MKLSIIVPAYNEEAMIDRCLNCIQKATAELPPPLTEIELVVVDNNSTDATADRARSHGARVVFEPERRIAGARNAGGRSAAGQWLLFIDADSFLSRELFLALAACMAGGSVGAGSALLVFDQAPWWGRLMEWGHRLFAPLVRCGAGPCLFIRRDGFEAIGGFRSDLYAAEELLFCKDAARWAKRENLSFRLLKKPNIVTSGRRFRINSLRDVVTSLWGVLRDPRSRERCAIWYDGRR